MQLRAKIHAEPCSCEDTSFYSEPSLHVDQFDRLPDCLVLIIFNKLADVRSLGRCCAVSKRFNALVPHVNNVYVKIDRVLGGDGDSDEPGNLTSEKNRNSFSYFWKLMLFTILKPFNQLQNSNDGSKLFLPQVSQHSPAQVLKNFKEIHDLKIELPAGDVATDDGILLRWRAEFGSTLRNCVILGGTKAGCRPALSNQEGQNEDNGCMPESFFTNGGLKLRVVWTISSLIAASTRHYLLRDIIKEHRSLKSLVFLDADGQGTLYMGHEHLKEFRENQLAPSASANRTQVPSCKMKLKYAPYMELSDGTALQGATLVAIKPAAEVDALNNSSRKETEGLNGSFRGSFSTAVEALARRRTYLLEMNGF